MTLISGAMLQQAMLREGRLADEPFGPEPPRGDDFVAFFEAAELGVGDRFTWAFDGEESEIVAIFEARQDDIFADEGDALIHYTAPEEDTPQVMGAETAGRYISDGEIAEVQG